MSDGQAILNAPRWAGVAATVVQHTGLDRKGEAIGLYNRYRLANEEASARRHGCHAALLPSGTGQKGHAGPLERRLLALSPHILDRECCFDLGHDVRR